VIAREIGGRPDRVENPKIGLRDKAQRLVFRRRPGKCPDAADSERSGGCGRFAQAAATETIDHAVLREWAALHNEQPAR
jgi:hypothetical protein